MRNYSWKMQNTLPVLTVPVTLQRSDSRADQRRAEASASFSKLLTGRYRASLQPFHLFIVFVFASGFMGWKVFKKTFHPRCSTLFFYLSVRWFFFFFIYDTYQIFLRILFFFFFPYSILSFQYIFWKLLSIKMSWKFEISRSKTLKNVKSKRVQNLQ